MQSFVRKYGADAIYNLGLSEDSAMGYPPTWAESASEFFAIIKMAEQKGMTD